MRQAHLWFHCDGADCDEVTPEAPTWNEARMLAEREGWRLGRIRHWCPEHRESQANRSPAATVSGV